MLRLLEGFELYGDSGRTGASFYTDIERRHDGAVLSYGSTDLVTGRGGLGLALEYHDDDFRLRLPITRFDPSTSSTWILGFALKPSEIGGGDIKIGPVTLAMTTGGLSILGANWSSSDRGIVNYAFKSGRWYYIEIKVYYHTSLGTIEVRVNENTVYSTTNKNTWTSGISNIFGVIDFSPNSTGLGGTAYDDIYLCDDTGTTNNDFLGTIKIETIRPSSDDGVQNWTPSIGGDHSALVDSSNLWQLTDYLEANGTTVDDLWVYNDLTKVNGIISGIQAISSAWTDVSMPQALQLICDSGLTLDYSNSRGIGAESDYPLPVEGVWETDPDTGVAWTIGGLNAASFGIRKV